ncbi:MAG: ATP-binding cassette domain-containing protein [Steroidobacterales bacterium]
MPGSVASARAVTKRFGRDGAPALDAVDLRIEAGHMTGLVGPDGAGKTTLIRILAGLIAPDSGEVTVLGRPSIDADRAQIGYMPQRFGLYEDLTVLENLNLYAALRGLTGADRSASFDRLLQFTDLKRFQGRLAGKLSGGMKQKLGLACALLRQPKLLLLDEPAVGVDPVSRRELWAMVRDLIGQGVGVLWSTAYLDEAERCDVVYLVHEGKLLHAGPPGEFTRRVLGRVWRVPVAADQRRPLLRRALDTNVVLDGVIQGDSLRLLTKTGDPDLAGIGASAAHAQAVTPRFEDAFVDMLGGGPRGTSELAANYGRVRDSDRAVIVAGALTKVFDDFTAAKDISFEVPRGQIFGLLGPNGAGKSTTFKMLCGLLTPTSGTGSVAGFDLHTARADARQALGYMAQKFSLYGDLSVRQNLDFFSGVYGMGGKAQKESIERVIEVFHLQRYLHDNSGALPLGYKQRLALACAVMHEPPVLFLDEPTSGVDPIVRREFWSHINGLVEKGVTVLVTTHFMEEAEYCDRIALIYRAREIAIGSPDELKAKAAAAGGPANPTLEEAFIALLQAVDNWQAEAAA